MLILNTRFVGSLITHQVSYVKREVEYLASASTNEGKSAATFCHQVVVWFPDMFCNFYLVKSHKTAKNSTTTKGREKISIALESLEFF
jgi:hypothetical protein